MTLKSIFTVDIYEAEYENFSDIQDSILEIIKPEFNNPVSGNEFFAKDGSPLITRTQNYLHYNPKLKNVVDFIENHIKEYWKLLNYTQRVDPYIIHMWANDIPPGGFTPSHHHNPIPIAGVFYLDADPRKGNLYLEDPLWPIQSLAPRDYAISPLMMLKQLEVKSGRLYLFPGWLQHHTKTNLTQESRYILGFIAGAMLDYKPKPTGQ